jgi:hypothetical protein
MSQNDLFLPSDENLESSINDCGCNCGKTRTTTTKIDNKTTVTVKSNRCGTTTIIETKNNLTAGPELPRLELDDLGVLIYSGDDEGITTRTYYAFSSDSNDTVDTRDDNDIILGSSDSSYGDFILTPNTINTDNSEDYVRNFGYSNFGGNDEGSLELTSSSYNIGIPGRATSFTEVQSVETSEFEKLIAGSTIWFQQFN